MHLLHLRRAACGLLVLLLLGALAMPGVAAAQAGSPPTPTEIAYLAATKPFRDRFGLYQEALVEYQLAASQGKLDAVAQTDLADLTRELFAARRAFTEAIPSTRLDQYDRTVKLALDRAYQATVMLLQARVTDSPSEREALVRQAAFYGLNGGRLLKDALDELVAVLPAAVPR